MRFIAIDSSQSSCSLALFDNGSCIGMQTELTPGKQVEQLFPLWQQLLDEAQFTLNDIDMLLTTLGPGSFAGTRIAIAACRAVAIQHNIPVHGITTLETIVRAHQPNGSVTACIDARRGQWYVQQFTNGIANNEATLLDDTTLTQQLNSAIIAYDPQNRFATCYSGNYTDSNIDAKTAGNAWLQQPDNDTKPLTPYYVRPPDAKISQKSFL